MKNFNLAPDEHGNGHRIDQFFERQFLLGKQRIADRIAINQTGNVKDRERQKAGVAEHAFREAVAQISVRNDRGIAVDVPRIRIFLRQFAEQERKPDIDDEDGHRDQNQKQIGRQVADREIRRERADDHGCGI